MFGKNKKDVVAVSTLPLEEFEFCLEEIRSCAVISD